MVSPDIPTDDESAVTASETVAPPAKPGKPKSVSKEKD